MTLEQFYKEYPKQSMEIKGKKFEYRYYKNVAERTTLVLLTGGIGLSDLFYEHFHRFTQDFSVITFDYLECYKTMAEFADAVGILLSNLNLKVWLVGQSLGGFVAQIITKAHPELVEGLVLSNTGSLAKDIDEVAFQGMKDMVDRQKKSRKIISVIPFGIAKKMMMKNVSKKAELLPEENRERMRALSTTMIGMLTKKYELHMIDMLTDCEDHLEMEKTDFAQLDNKVLLILSDDDKTFNDNTKQSLINLMPNPTVVTDLGGGHLGALMQIEKYAELVTDYVLKR